MLLKPYIERFCCQFGDTHLEILIWHYQFGDTNWEYYRWCHWICHHKLNVEINTPEVWVAWYQFESIGEHSPWFGAKLGSEVPWSSKQTSGISNFLAPNSAFQIGYFSTPVQLHLPQDNGLIAILSLRDDDSELEPYILQPCMLGRGHRNTRYTHTKYRRYIFVTVVSFYHAV